jgi:hypothetical protein
MVLILTGGQLLVLAALLAVLCVLCGSIGAVSWYMRGYDLGQADAAHSGRPCPDCATAAAAVDTVVFGPVPMDLISSAMDIAEHQLAAAYSGDPVLQGRVLELEIDRMIEQADRKVGRFR